MKKIIFISCLFLFVLSNNNGIHAQTSTDYDSVFAKKLNADDYRMKTYMLVILKKGLVTITDSKQRDSIFNGHMNNIKKLAAENKLLLAGPMGENEK